jgi:DNA-binding transcriptional MerR regulator
MLIKDPISLVDLARELSVNKSKLAYYTKIGILKPAMKIGSMFIYEKSEAKKRLKCIETAKLKHNVTLSEFIELSKDK